MPEAQTLLTLSEAADRLGASRSLVHKLISRGLLTRLTTTGHKPGLTGTLFVPLSEVEGLVRSRARRQD